MLGVMEGIGRIALALLVVGIAGCDRGPRVEASAAGGAGAGGAAEVRLGYFGNVTHAQAVLGVASGDFAAAVAPAALSTRVFNAGPALIEALLTGNVDVGYVGPGPVLSAHERSRGEGVRVIAGAAANGVLIVARKDANVRSLADLAGKRIATPQHANTQDIAARHFVLAGLNRKDTNNVLAIANAEQAGLMRRGQIDAAWAPEPWGSRLIAEAGAVKIADEKDLWPGKRFVLTVLVTTPAFLRDHPQTVKRLLAVHTKWTALLRQNPRQYEGQLGDALYALSGKKLPAGVLGESLKNVEFTNDPLPETFATINRWAFELGFARRVAPLDGLIDTTLLQSLP